MRSSNPKAEIESVPLSKIYGGDKGALSPKEKPDPKAIESAVQRGDAAAIIGLVMRGIHPDAIKTSNGATALTVAIADKNLPLVEELLRSKACPDGTDHVSYLSLALRGSQDKYPDKKIVSLLLQYGADPNRKDPAQGKPPVAIALEMGLVESSLLLLEAGADPGAADEEGESGYRELDSQRVFVREMLYLRMRKLGKSPEKSVLETLKAKTFREIEKTLSEEE